MEKIIEILKRNKGKEITISANYNDTEGELFEVDEKAGFVSIRINKKEIKYIDISKIYEITEQIK